jgi:hypothetical protein
VFVYSCGKQCFKNSVHLVAMMGFLNYVIGPTFYSYGDYYM